MRSEDIAKRSKFSVCLRGISVSRFGCQGQYYCLYWDSSYTVELYFPRRNLAASALPRAGLLGDQITREAPADGVLSNGSRGHAGKACAAERGSRDGNGWDSLAIAATSLPHCTHMHHARPTKRRSSIAAWSSSCMRCSTSPAVSGDGFRARAGGVLLAGAHAARVRRKHHCNHKLTAAGPPRVQPTTRGTPADAAHRGVALCSYHRSRCGKPIAGGLHDWPRGSAK